MNPDLTEIARRAVACKGWRWVPGMLARTATTTWGFRVLLVHNDQVRLDCSDLPHCQWRDAAGRFPDLTDAATLGCLLVLVREAWGMPTGITVAYSDDTGRWIVSWSGATHGGVCGEGATEGEALLRALLNAP